MSNVFEGYKDKRVVVTGAASGMGAAVAGMLVDLGAVVIGADIKPIEMKGVSSNTLNLMDDNSIQSFVGAIEDGSVYGLFCCAGLPQTFSAIDVVTVNFLGTRRLCELMLPKFTQSSAISVVASMTLAWPQHIAALTELIEAQSLEKGRDWVSGNLDTVGDSYMFSKEALAAWATITSTRWIQRGVRLNCLCPGVTETPMLAAFHEAVPGELEQLPQPLNRPCTADEQAFAMLLLNHPKNQALVGASLYNDGGSSAAIMGAVAAGLFPM